MRGLRALKHWQALFTNGLLTKGIIRLFFTGWLMPMLNYAQILCK